MKKTVLTLAIATLLAGCNPSDNDSQPPAPASQAYEYLVQLSSSAEGIGARPTGTEAETRAAAWIQDHLTGWGYEVQNQPFSYTKSGASKQSQNLIAELKGQSDKVILIGAHYDSTGDKKGSEGATDNGAGVAALLAVAEALKDQTLPYTVRFAFFGAEENGLNGSKAYAAGLDGAAVAQLLAMVNYDTIAGGDIVYVHSAHSDVAEYSCAEPGRYSFDPKVRDRLLAISKQGATPFAIHPSYPGYPEGETGSWSDHAPFACLGVPVAYVEATNFTIDGADGYDGYSQSTNPALWDCYDEASKSACDRDSETQWGKVWHTQYDRLDKMAELFPGRVQQQLGANTDLMIRFLKEPGL
ncbi:M20/M25/M40 family metallo-hydrolase [Aeromonas sp. MR16]|uniref:M28 family metallopeptidase n=1 Tax=Aeromonas sp. MR16 TaxID=2923420 RepID=UPI001F4A249B|nr:M20/M25/M40 family metallo-hydrolase [Aeromonas sp. MR16]MCH7373382.1 M20/M25/M40 family metallo-hydrolase [Aeromonas sp. MR16]